MNDSPTVPKTKSKLLIIRNQEIFEPLKFLIFKTNFQSKSHHESAKMSQSG